MIVNSIDSYSVQKGLPKVGKFGMGFFSILYFLIGHPLRHLVIVTIENKKAVLLTIRYSKTKNNLYFNLNYITTESGSGTYIHMETENDPFTQEQVDLFSEFLSYTRFVKNANINHYHHFYQNVKVNLSESPNLIVSRLSIFGIRFEDYATGISIENVLSSLLVPSTSTKTMKISDEVIEYKNESRFTIKDIYEPFKFYIVCNHIVIVKIDILEYTNGDVVLTVPSTIRLPVSRDDVIFTESVAFESLGLLLEASIKKESVIELEKSIDAYINYTSNNKNKEIFNRFKNEMYDTLKKRGLITIKDTNYKFISSLVKDSFIKSVRNDTMSIEDKLDLVLLDYKEDIFSNKRVIFLDKKVFTSGGTYKYIFVGPDVHTKPNWKENAIVNFQEERLFLVSNIKSEESSEIDEVLKEFQFTKKETSMIRKLLTIFLSLQDRLILDSKRDSMRELVYGIYFISVADPLFMDKYIDMLSNYFINISISYSYGMSKFNLKYNTCFLDQSKDIVYNMPHFRRTYLKDIDKIDKYKLREYVKNRILLLSDKMYLSYYNFTSGILNDLLVHILPYMKKHTSLSIFETIFLSIVERSFCFVKDENIITVKSIYELYIKEIGDYKLTSVPYWKTNIILSYACNALCFSLKDIPIKKDVFDTDFKSQFTFKQLLTHVFLNSNVDQIEPNYIKHSPKNEKLQLLEIAVDAGTNKPFLQATLTELFQNSLDAYRLEKIDKKIVQITIKQIGEKMMVSVTDYIGMTPSNIMALSIPIYSNKVSSPIVTGEMGTGFFNIYRESEFVMIDTNRDNKRVVMKDRPIRDKRGNIIDIEKNVEYTFEKEINRTEISFVIDYTPNVVSDIYYYSTNVLSYMDIQLSINDEKITTTKKLIYTENNLSFYYTKTPIISFIFTKGVPFSPLIEYLKKNKKLFDLSNECISEISSGVIIDIGHDFYLPTQSRTDLQISHQNIFKLKKFLERIVFYVSIFNFNNILDNYSHKDYRVSRNIYLSNMGDLPLDQVLPNLKDLNYIPNLKSILMYTPLNGLKIDMAHIITELYQLIGKNAPKSDEILDYFEKLKPQSKETKEVFNYYKQIIFKWIIVKNQTSSKDNMKEDSESDSDSDVNEFKYDRNKIDETVFIQQMKLKQKSVLKDLKLVFSTFVDTFLTRTKEYPSITISLKKLKSYGILAQYCNSKIDVNTDRIDAKNYLHFIRNIDNYLLNIGNLRNDVFYDMWFSNSNPASVIAHELEHARRNSAHDQGVHDSVTYKGKIYSFDEIATQMVRDADITVEWLQLLRKELK